MSWQMAVVGALGVAQYQQQGAYGKFNQQVQNRNAEVAEQEAQIIDSKLKLDLDTFDKKFRQLQGETTVALAKSGVDEGGTATRIRISNLTERELEKNKMEYDAAIGKARAFENANFARIKGQMAREEAKVAQLRTLTSTGTSLLSMQG